MRQEMQLHKKSKTIISFSFCKKSYKIRRQYQIQNVFIARMSINKKLMKKSLIWLAIAILIILGIYFFNGKKAVAPAPEKTGIVSRQQPNQQTGEPNKDRSDLIKKEQKLSEVPLDRAKERVNKKPFGIFIAPKTSPMQPERFSGYHTGADFEILPEELNTDVFMRAICDGALLSKRIVGGYGGVLVQSCQLGGQDVTVVYGHIALSSVNSKIGDEINYGENIALLGADKSKDTDGERKHLHLGIHRGKAVNILGYVANESDLSAWLDPCDFVCK